VEFLGYFIFGNGVRMNPRKVQTIVDWATLASIHDVQCFFSSPISINDSLHIIPQ
jgi:hypothetical protein